MQELIKINTQEQTVSARDLHSYLGSKRDFSTWIKDRIEKYGLVENIDFTTFTEIVERAKRIEYVLTLDAAKQLAMVEGNKKGKDVRLYFIQCEKELKQPSKPATYLDLAQIMIESIKAQESRMAQIEQKHVEIEARIDTIDTNFISVVGYARINNIQLPGNEALKIGKQAGKISREQGITIGKVFDAKYGSINTYHKDILQTVFHNSTAR
jgi:anti-repressor protein